MQIDTIVDTSEKIGEFWDTHDFTDFDNPDLPDVEFEVTCVAQFDFWDWEMAQDGTETVQAMLGRATNHTGDNQ